jgi:hypothetical protein
MSYCERPLRGRPESTPIQKVQKRLTWGWVKVNQPVDAFRRERRLVVFHIPTFALEWSDHLLCRLIQFRLYGRPKPTIPLIPSMF